VAASNIPALRELGSDTVRYANPKSSSDCADAIGAALDRRAEALALA